MNGTKRRGWKGMLPLAGLLCAAGGCVQESNANGEQIYQYELWVPVAVLLAGLAAVPIGFVLRKRSVWASWCLVVGGPIAALLLTPSLYRDRVVVSSNGFHVRTGIWGLTAVHSLEFAEIQQIRITSETSYSRQGKRTNYYLNCDKKTGESSKVGINNAVTEASAEAILRGAKSHGIPIRDETAGQ